MWDFSRVFSRRYEKGEFVKFVKRLKEDGCEFKIELMRGDSIKVYYNIF